MVDKRLPLNDKESHLLTKLKRDILLNARNKLGQALLEANVPMKIQFNEFFEMMKDKSEWMAPIQEINWVESKAEQIRPGEEL